ncbi:MAG: HAD hydrolase family protein, partial [Planctomycetota bacterium]
MNLVERCAAIELLLTDVDGVLTDGGVVLDDRGVETKRFSIRDGLAVRLWQNAGGNLGIVTGRSSRIVARRADELDIRFVRQGVDEKLPVVREISQSLRLSPEQVAFIGDDLPDLPPIRWAGLGVAVGDAVVEVRDAAEYVTSAVGGQGALREVVELLLKSSDRWQAAVERF